MHENIEALLLARREVSL